MADAVITVVLEKILDVAKDKVLQLLGVDKQLRKISSSLKAIQALLHDAETRQIQDDSVRSWLLKLKDLSYEMEDLIEEWTLKSRQISSLVLNKGWMVRSYAFPIYYFKHFCLRIKFGREIAEMKERLDQIGVEKEHFQFRKLKMKEKIVGTPTHSFIDERIVMRREEDREILINKLFEGSSTDNIRVIAIVGMGGIGKTTLAQIIFNDEGVKDYFEPRLWVCVSNDFDAKNIIIKTIEVGGGGHYSRETQIETVAQKLQVMLAKKTYLLVLDDVWNENYTKWEELNNVLMKCGSNKSSRIVVTTRSTKVAEVVGSQYTHSLALLSDDDCWLIFKRIALEGKSDDGLEDVGRRIVEKCKGLPLAVKTVAGAMRCEHSRESWEEVLNSEIWTLPQSEGDIIQALLLSFNELPLHLRQCFGYMSIFPKDYLGPVIWLIKMWVAQGYVTHSDGKDAEDVGEEYFRELVGRSFMHCELFSNADVEEPLELTMHDLVHDVAQFVMRDDQLHLYHRGEPLMSWATGLRTLLLDSDHCRGIGQYRSLRILELTIVRMEDMDQIGNLIHLRLLIIKGRAIKSLPKSLKRLELLQYFVISEAEIRVLPEWICDLHDLRELRLNYCFELEKLPEKIHLMTNLRYFYIRGTQKVTKSFFISKIGKLTRLRALPDEMFPGTFRVMMIPEAGKSRSNIGQLSNLNNLRKKLIIENLDMVSTGEEASTARLEDKRFIQSLTLSWGTGEWTQKNVSKAESVIEALRPPRIRKLRIWGYPGQKLWTWIENGDLLSRLLELTLENFINCTCLPALGRLPFLKILHISGLPALIEVTGNDFSGGFPCLEELHFGSMENWKAWDTQTTTFPRLRELEFVLCFKLQVLPEMSSLKELQVLRIIGCPQLGALCKRDGPLWSRISHIPTIQIR